MLPAKWKKKSRVSEIASAKVLEKAIKAERTRCESFWGRSGIGMLDGQQGTLVTLEKKDGALE